MFVPVRVEARWRAAVVIVIVADGREVTVPALLSSTPVALLV